MEFLQGSIPPICATTTDRVVFMACDECQNDG
jgi:hypothetical protein